MRCLSVWQGVFLFSVIVVVEWFQIPNCVAVNTESIRLATEYQVQRARDYVQDNYEYVINSGENYNGCPVYDMCTDPPTLYSDSSATIDPWDTTGTAWHFPQCDDSDTLIGVRPNNHNPETGEVLTSSTCPKYDEYIGCDYDNSLTTPGIKIPTDVDTSSQVFLDATCFTNELEDIWTTRIYSNCDSVIECGNGTWVNITYTVVENGTNMTYTYPEYIYYTDVADLEAAGISCLSYGVCSNTPEPEVNSFTPDYVEYQYYGDQRTGILSQIPALYWDALDTGSCPGSYDPRFRPWYAATASGPKDMILILDTSGSMATDTGNGQSRLTVMKQAAIAVLDTLTSDDYATVIEFSTNAESYSSTLVSVTDENRCYLENYIDDLSATGLTNYENAFNAAFDIMSDSVASEDVSGCYAQVILFLTDGAITGGRADIADVIDELKTESASNNEGIDVKILTYGIGGDLASDDLSTLKSIACDNEGIFYEITDIDDDLSSTMASYYQMFVSLRDTSSSDSVVWIDYTETLTGYRLISANLPVYDKTTSPYTLLGVVVSDVAAERLIDSDLSAWGEDVGLYDDFDEVFSDMLDVAKQCPTLDFDSDQLEVIRASIDGVETCASQDTANNNKNGLGIGLIVAIVLMLKHVML